MQFQLLKRLTSSAKLLIGKPFAERFASVISFLPAQEALHSGSTDFPAAFSIYTASPIEDVDGQHLGFEFEIIRW